jgi:dihydrofolate reductase
MGCKFRVYIGTSLDGFIARTNGSIEWLMEYEPPSAGEDYGYADFMKETDTVVLGRKTYELALTFSEWPYRGKKVVVLTTKSLDSPKELHAGVSLTSDSPNEIKNKLEQAGSRKVYVDGGQTIQSFIRAGLVQEITITRVPILLGGGLALFGKTEADVKLEHLTTRSYTNGFVQSTYRVIGAA